MPSPAFILALLATSCNAFHAPFAASSFRLPTSWYSRSTAVDNDELIACIKLEIEASISSTDGGRSTSPSQKDQIHSLISKLESMCSLSAPARDPRMDGPWIVLYTDAPPPSNGQLLIWRGTAKQVINMEGGRYRNEPYVDNDQDAWLTAILDASWEEWDGVYLDESGDSALGIDFGSSTWKVTFQSLTISLFDIPIFRQQFEKVTARTWKMTYLDDQTRVVRAGKTGQKDDDLVFYMRRGN